MHPPTPGASRVPFLMRLDNEKPAEVLGGRTREALGDRSRKILSELSYYLSVLGLRIGAQSGRADISEGADVQQELG